MLQFKRVQLSNGLTVILNSDEHSPFVVVNVTYNVGAKDEEPNKTGLAHLFEHLMFSGSKNAPHYDKPLEIAGASNNAFTNNDLTNYYVVIPRENIETALWLESDRMSYLNVDQKKFEVQQKVVIEEFKERYLNKPYGTSWHYLRQMAYSTHPYQWPTIGKTIEQIEAFTLEDIKEFYAKYYNPSNAILTLTGKVDESDLPLVEKWFGSLPAGTAYKRNLNSEPKQSEARRLDLYEDVPLNSIYMAFHMPGKNQPGYFECDLLSDILSNGSSSRLYQQLVKKQALFSDLSAYILGSFDPGLFIITGKPHEGVSKPEAESAIWNQLDLLQSEPPSEQELQKVKNKVEANLVYQLIEPLNQAINLAFFELIGDATDLNKEQEKYQAVSLNQLTNQASHLFTKENSNTLWINSNQKNDSKSSDSTKN